MMSLIIDVRDIADDNIRELYSFSENGRQFNLACGLMHIGINEITEKNKVEVATRFKILEGVVGPMRQFYDEEADLFNMEFYSMEEIDKLVGVHTNVPLKTKAQFMKEIYDQAFHGMKNEYDS